MPPPPSVIPVVRLDVDTISDVLAAGLASSLVGHVLFLKNQVPLPVMQLARMATRKTRIPNSVGETTTSTSATTGDEKEKKATARLATREGRAAKSQAELLASFDTLASHLTTTFTALSTAFARREDTVGEGDGRKSARAYLVILVGQSVGTAKVKVVLGLDGLEVKVWGKREEEEEEKQEEEEQEEEEQEEEEEEEEQEEAHEEADDDEGPPPSPSPSPSPPASPPPATPAHYISHAQQQQVLLTSERLLSRTLALADAEGHGMASDMGPTQTHILIRAPRRFSHPAWIPRQNVIGMMECVLNEFLEGGVGKRKVEGVWVVCSGGGGGEEEAVKEEDEMIWWKWEGRLVGFSDWAS